MAEERTGCIGVGRDKCRDYNEGKSEDQCKRDDRNGYVDVSKDVGTVENDGNGFESNSMDEEYDKVNTTDGDVGEGEGAIDDGGESNKWNTIDSDGGEGDKRSTNDGDGGEGDKRSTNDGDGGEGDRGSTIDGDGGEGDKGSTIDGVGGEGDKGSTIDGDGGEGDKGSTIDGDGGEGDKGSTIDCEGNKERAINLDESKSVGVRQDEKMWITKLGLYSHDHSVLLSDTKWVNDNIIYASQLLLKKQSKGKIEGWHSTQCCKLKELFPPLAPAARYIQILNVCENHWIVASNIKVHCNDIYRESVCIYDSMWHTSVSLSAKKQIC